MSKSFHIDYIILSINSKKTLQNKPILFEKFPGRIGCRYEMLYPRKTMLRSKNNTRQMNYISSMSMSAFSGRLCHPILPPDWGRAGCGHVQRTETLRQTAHGQNGQIREGLWEGRMGTNEDYVIDCRKTLVHLKALCRRDSRRLEWGWVRADSLWQTWPRSSPICPAAAAPLALHWPLRRLHLIR